jgi:hypothetical protein
MLASKIELTYRYVCSSVTRSIYDSGKFLEPVNSL